MDGILKSRNQTTAGHGRAKQLASFCSREQKRKFYSHLFVSGDSLLNQKILYAHLSTAVKPGG